MSDTPVEVLKLVETFQRNTPAIDFLKRQNRFTDDQIDKVIHGFGDRRSIGRCARGVVVVNGNCKSNHNGTTSTTNGRTTTALTNSTA